MFTQVAFHLLALALFVNGLAVPETPDIMIGAEKRSNPGFIKLDFDVMKGSELNTSSGNKDKRDPFESPLTNHVAFYNIDLNFGSQAQTIAVRIDTGSSDLWVLDTKTGQTPAFDSSSSSSFKKTGAPFTIGYGDQTEASGDWATDSIGFPGGPSIHNFQFADVTKTSTNTAGFLGIAPTYDESTSDKYPNFPLALKDAGITKKAAYSLYLNHLDAASGAIIFGGIDSAKYEGSLATLPLLKTGGVSVTLSNITTPDGNTYPVNNWGLLDTGTTISTVPDDVINGILKALPGSSIDEGNKGLIRLASCSIPGDPSLDWNFNGKIIKNYFSDLIQHYPQENSECYIGLVSNNLTRGVNLWGDSFLRSAYIVVDYDDSIVQIAQAKNSEESSIIPIN